jgi:hypothetical protein
MYGIASGEEKGQCNNGEAERLAGRLHQLYFRVISRLSSYQIRLVSFHFHVARFKMGGDSQHFPVNLNILRLFIQSNCTFKSTTREANIDQVGYPTFLPIKDFESNAQACVHSHTDRDGTAVSLDHAPADCFYACPVGR